jgi:protein-disulfide isomerase
MTRLLVPVNANDHRQGSADAAWTLVEYGDYECPVCGRAYPSEVFCSATAPMREPFLNWFR